MKMIVILNVGLEPAGDYNEPRGAGPIEPAGRQHRDGGPTGGRGGGRPGAHSHRDQPSSGGAGHGRHGAAADRRGRQRWHGDAEWDGGRHGYGGGGDTVPNTGGAD